ncbi:MAG: T9SS type A sorting domain-containing protein [Bacteroidota bacterium]
MRQKTNLRLQKKYNCFFKILKVAIIKIISTITIYQRKRLSYNSVACKSALWLSTITITFLSFENSAYGQFDFTGSEFQINSYTNLDQSVPKVAIDKSGNFIVVWQSEEQEGNYYGIYAQRYDKLRNPIGEEFRISDNPTGHQLDASLAMNDGGEFIITWTQYDSNGDNTNILGKRYDKDGNSLNGFQVNTETAGFQSNSSVAINDSGEIIVTWRSNSINPPPQDGSSGGIFGQKFNRFGIPQGVEFQVNTYSINDQSSPSVTIDNSGDFIVSWSSFQQDGSFNGIYAQRFNKDCTPEGKEFQVNTYTFGDQAYSKIVMNDDGDFIIAWQSSGQDGSQAGIYAQKYTHNGTKDGNEFRVNTRTFNSQALPSLTMNNAGDFIISWVDLNLSQLYKGIYIQKFSSLGVKLGTETRVSTSNLYSHRNPSIALNDKGNIIVVWQSNIQDGDGTGIFGQYLDIAGSDIPNVTTLVLNTCTRPYSASFDAVPDATGYQVQITVLARNGEILTRRIDDNEISGNFNIPRRLLGTDVEIQIAAIFLDEDTGKEVIGEFSETGIFTLGCDEAGNLVLESRNTALNSIQLSPNPVQNQLQLQLQSDIVSAAELKILSLEGKIVLEQRQEFFEGQNELNIDIAPLAAGAYFLQIITNKGVEKVKFVKM